MEWTSIATANKQGQILLLSRASSTYRWSAVIQVLVNKLLAGLPRNTQFAPDIRMNSENVILGAIWCGPKKPCMEALLGPHF